MHGSIEVSSVLNQGSVFTLWLPLRQPAEHLIEDSSPRCQVKTAPAILAVEDNPVGLTVLRHALERATFRSIARCPDRQRSMPPRNASTPWS